MRRLQERGQREEGERRTYPPQLPRCRAVGANSPPFVRSSGRPSGFRCRWCRRRGGHFAGSSCGERRHRSRRGDGSESGYGNFPRNAVTLRLDALFPCLQESRCIRSWGIYRVFVDWVLMTSGCTRYQTTSTLFSGIVTKTTAGHSLTIRQCAANYRFMYPFIPTWGETVCEEPRQLRSETHWTRGAADRVPIRRNAADITVNRSGAPQPNAPNAEEKRGKTTYSASYISIQLLLNETVSAGEFSPV